MGSSMVPLDRVLLGSYRLSIVTISLSVTVWPQSAVQMLTGGSDSESDPKSPLPRSPCLIRCYMGPRVSLPNGISFRPAALAGCTSVTDIQTDHATRDHLSE